jgi:hypothetical protein
VDLGIVSLDRRGREGLKAYPICEEGSFDSTEHGIHDDT